MTHTTQTTHTATSSAAQRHTGTLSALAVPRSRHAATRSADQATKPQPPLPPRTVDAVVSACRPASILRLHAVLAKLGISRTGLYERIKRGEFPKQIQLGPKTVGWLQHEVEDWLADRIEASRRDSGSLL